MGEKDISLKKLEEIRNLIRKDQIELSISLTFELLRLFKKGIESNPFYWIRKLENELLWVQNRLKRVKDESLLQIKPDESITIDKNRIIRHYLDLLSDIERVISEPLEFIDDDEKRFINSVKDIEYFVYLSKDKVEMLYSQLPEERNTSINKLKLLVESLNEVKMIGGLNDSKPYIYGEITMKVCVFQNRNVIFFQKNHDPKVFLFGSIKHLLGGNNEINPRDLNMSNSSMAGFLRNISEVELPNIEKKGEDYGKEKTLFRKFNRLISYFENQNDYHSFEEKYKFIAVRYKTLESDSKIKIVIGSPVFVSLIHE